MKTRGIKGTRSRAEAKPSAPGGEPQAGLPPVFGSAIDLFGSGPIRGVTHVDSTMAVPGPLVDPGCPIHGVGCPEHCPMLRLAREASR